MKNHHYGWFFVIFFVKPRVGKWGARQWRVIVPMGAWGVRIAWREVAENRVFGSKSDNCPKFTIFVKLQILPFCGVAGWSICRQSWCTVCRVACDGAGAYIYNNVYCNPCFYIQFLVISAVNNQIERKQPRFVAIRNTYCAFCCNFGAKSGRNPFIYSEVCRYC